MKIYTKSGDEGQTGLIGGTRVLKNDVRVEAYGTVDELNAFVGLLVSYGNEIEFLQSIQQKLFSIGAYLATDVTKAERNISVITDEDIKDIEREIDKLNESLPDLKEFILPGGSIEGGISHVCRTVSRRAERRIVDLGEMYIIESQIYKYMNRLSDYFFVLSRYITLKKGLKEFFWKK